MTNPFDRSILRNRLLRALRNEEFELIAPHLRQVDLPFGSILEAPGKTIELVIFLESGIASRLIVGKREETAESGHIGFEGLVGRPIILGANRATNLVQMQIEGVGYAVETNVLSDALNKRKELRQVLMNYVLASDLQAECTLLAATNHTIVQRLSRWLLMYHDRVEGDEFHVTHRLLAQMLNVRRAGVTEAMHVLEGRCSIQSSRGRVHVADRALLERLAGGSYRIPEAYYDEIIPSG